MFKKIALALAAFFWVGPVSAVVPGTVASVNSIADLRTVSLADAALHPSIIVTDYYGTSSGCPIQYKWNASDSTADNGGSIINPTGNVGAGRWNLNLPPKSPVHSCVFGIVADNTPGAGGGTNYATQMQALMTWANTSGPNWVHIDGKRDKCIRVDTTLIPGEGLIVEGDGALNITGGNSYGTCISFQNTGYLFALQTPYPGLGTTPFQGPQFRDFTMLIIGGTSAGGCIQLNSIAGGFTDDTTSQQPIIQPQFKNLYCSMQQLNNTAKIGFQCSKCTEGSATGVTAFGGNIGFDIEGSENFAVIGPGRVSGTFGPSIKFQAHNTFGNSNSVSDMQLLGFAAFGQTVDSMIYNASRSSLITNNVFENLTGAPNPLSVIHLSASCLTASITSNKITVSSTNWLLVDGVCSTLSAYGNGNYGVGLSTAKFLQGKYKYNDAVNSVLSHYGNGVSMDSGWPFNTKNAYDQALPYGVQQIWSPDYYGLLGSAGHGSNEIPVEGAFTFPVTGSGNFLEFIPNRGPLPVGTFDIQIRAWQTNGTGSITCQLTDNGVLVGSPLAASLTIAPKWFTLAFNQVISTSAGVRCWDTGGSSAGNPSMLNLIKLVHH